MILLKRTIQFLLGAAVFSPLVFSHNFYYPYVTSKVLFFRVVVLLALIVWAIYFYQRKRIEFKVNYIWWIYLSLFVAMLVSSIFGVSFMRSFWSNFERADGIVLQLHLLLFFILLSLTLTSWREWKWFLRAVVFASLLTSLYGLLQYVGLFEAMSSAGARIGATLGNPAYLANYAVMSLFLSIYLSFKEDRRAWQVFYYITSVVFILAILLTQTRGAILGLALGFMLLAILNLVSLPSEKYKIKRFSAILLTLIILAGGFIFIFKDKPVVKQNPIVNRVASISLESHTAQTRLAAWGVAFRAFQDRPIFGWGVEDYSYAFSKYFPPSIYESSDSKIWFDKAHSVFFEYLVTTGAVGALLYVALLVYLVYVLWKKTQFSRLEANILISLIVAYFVANMFVFDTLATYIVFIAVLAFVAHYHVDSKQYTLEYQPKTILFLGVILAVMLHLGYLWNIQAMRDNKTLLQAQVVAAQNKAKYTQDAHQSYNKLLDGNNSFTRFEGSLEFAGFTRQQTGHLPDYERQAIFDDAIAEMQKTIEMDPHQVRYRYNLNELYLQSYNYQTNRVDKVLESKDKLVELAPTRAHTYYQIGQAYVHQGEYDKAIEQFNKAVELNPEVVETHINVYVAALFGGKVDLLDKLEEKIKKLSANYFEKEENLVRFISVYKNKGYDERFEKTMEKLIELKPDKLEYYSTLAIYYAESGQNQKAIQVISRLKGVSQNLDAQVADFIKKINQGDFIKE